MNISCLGSNRNCIAVRALVCVASNLVETQRSTKPYTSRGAFTVGVKMPKPLGITCPRASGVVGEAGGVVYPRRWHPSPERFLESRNVCAQLIVDIEFDCKPEIVEEERRVRCPHGSSTVADTLA